MSIIKRYIAICSILLITLFVTGCSTIKFYFPDDLTYIDELIEKHEYLLALRFIDQQDKKSAIYPELIKRRPLIINQMTHYELTTLEQSNQLIEAEMWSDAIELLEDALTHIPKSKKLAQKLTKLKRIRDEKVDQLQYQITLHEAQAINKDRALYEHLYKLDSTTSITPEIIQERAKTIADNLLKRTITFVNNRETIKARNTLKLAGEVVPEIRRSSEFRKLIKEIEEIEKEISKAIKKKQAIDQQRQLKEFNLLFKQGNFLDAQIILKKIEKRFGKTDSIKGLRKRLNSAVSLRIKEHMDNGMVFYSKEQIEDAIKEWQHVLQLAPDHQDALENISRAGKVLQQLQKVRENQNP